MIKRTITGAVIFLLTVGFVLLKTVHPLFFDAYALIITYGALYEVIKTYKIAGKRVYIMPLALIPALVCLIFNFEFNSLVKIGLLVLIVVLTLMFALTFDITGYAESRNQNSNIDTESINSTLFDGTKFTMQTLAYPLVPLSFFIVLNHIGNIVSLALIVLAFSISMLTDTMAYFVGSTLGKRKFIPEVSPNKSIAGVVGGFIGGLLGACLTFIVFYFFNINGFKDSFELWKLITMFALSGIFGSYLNQIGDLVASAFKRKVGIKDYSNIFPGHGGFMDRVDGLMFVLPFIFALAAILLV
ncbi:MAG: phosphatidate cytidylyltransferase [Clostridia bacterium]|nr:phosphatidate cytidylyltransferase [Clostridia bacterium]